MAGLLLGHESAAAAWAEPEVLRVLDGSRGGASGRTSITIDRSLACL